MVLLLLACTAAIHPAGDSDGSGTDPGLDTADPLPGDTSEDTGEPVDTGDTADTPDDYDDLFTLERVHTIDITLSKESERALRLTPKEYVEGAVTVDGEVYELVGVRLKGSGSFQDLNGKAAFKIDFNRYDEGQSYHGKGKFTLNNMLHDENQTHEVVAYAAFRAAGIPASRVGYAWVTVNGEDYGLYTNVETADRDYLERNVGHRDGNLYEGGYPYYPDSWDHADFSAAEIDNFQLETGTDLAYADLEAVLAAMGSPPDTLDAELGAVVDLDQYARYQILESWAGQWDGYAFASNNFRVYVDHGGDEKLRMVPTGLDYCFTDYGGKMFRASSPLGAKCQADATCNARFDTVIDQTLADVDAAGLEALMDEAAALTRPYVEDDPRNAIDERNLDASLEVMRTWIQTRSGKVSKWYAPRE